MTIDYVAPPEVISSAPPLDEDALSAARRGVELLGAETSGPLRFEGSSERDQARANGPFIVDALHRSGNGRLLTVVHMVADGSKWRPETVEACQ